MPPAEISDLRSSIDPARRYNALVRAALRARDEGTSFDMLERMVELVAARFELAEGESEGDLLERVEVGVRSAVATYDSPTARHLFDACLLAGASAEDLEAAFSVSEFETAAYATLFFDRSVFPNAFHVIGYVASRESEEERALLRVAQQQGFDAIAAQYGVCKPVSPEAAVADVLAADAAAYRRVRDMPVTHRSAKEVRERGKQVVNSAVAMQKIRDSKSLALERGKDVRKDDFIIVPAPANPTLAELMAAGGVIATPRESGPNDA